MGIINSLFKAFGYEKMAKQVAGAMGGALTTSLITGERANKIPTPTDYKNYADLYKEIPIVFASTFAISTIGADLPIKMFEEKIVKDKIERKEILEHRALQVLKKPNPSMSEYDLKEATFAYLELTGNTFWELAKAFKPEEIKIPGGIYVLRPDRVKALADDEGKNIIGYEYSVNVKSGKTVKQLFKPDEIVHFKYFHPTEDWYGQSSIQAATDTILTQQYATTYNKKFFENDAIVPGMFVAEKGVNITEDQLKDMIEKFEKAHKGVEKSHKVGFMTGGFNFVRFTEERKDMQFVEMQSQNRQDIMMCHRVNNAILGLLENMTYDNYRMQVQSFMRFTMKPKCKKISSVLNSFYLPKFGKPAEGTNLTLEFDLSEYLGEDKLTMMNILRLLFEVAGVTPNEIIKILGIGTPYDTGGNEYYVSQGFIPVGATPSAQQQYKRNVVEAVQELEKKLKPVLEMFEKLNKQGIGK